MLLTTNIYSYHTAIVGVIESLNKLYGCTFATPTATNKSHCAALLDVKV